MRRFSVILTCLLLCVMPCQSLAAELEDFVKGLPIQSQPAQSAQGHSAASSLPQGEIDQGLKEALGKGASKAVGELGHQDGFLGNPDVRILLPSGLRQAEPVLRAAGQGQLVDDFVLTVNRAAEQAVPEAAPIFMDAIKAMTMQDARNILQGPNDSATKYLRKTSGQKIYERMLPIVRDATDKTGATSRFKAMTNASPMIGQLAASQGFDLDGYVTNKALDGLFLMIAREEKGIRTNPAERTTDLLRKVFGGS